MICMWPSTAGGLDQDLGSGDEIRGEVVARLKLVLAGLAGCYCLITWGTSPCWGTSDDG